MIPFELNMLIICGAFIALLVNTLFWRGVTRPPHYLSQRARMLLNFVPFFVMGFFFIGVAFIVLTNGKLFALMSFPMFYGILLAFYATLIIYSLLQALRGPLTYRRHWVHVTINTVLLVVMQIPPVLPLLQHFS